MINDVVVQALRQGHEAALIELNEDRQGLREFPRWVAQAISRAVRSR